MLDADHTAGGAFVLVKQTLVPAFVRPAWGGLRFVAAVGPDVEGEFATNRMFRTP